MEKRAIYIPDIRFEEMNVFKLNEKLQVFEMINDKEITYEKEVVLNDDNFLLLTIDQDKTVSLVENRDKINLLDCCYMNIKIKKLTNELLPLDLLLQADPNEKLVKEYVEKGEVYLSFLDDEYFNDELVGVAVTLKVNKNDLEIKNISIKDEFQNKKYAKKMIEFLTKLAKEEGYDNLIIATGNSSINQLALYQKCGFSIDYIKKDFFTLNYDEEIIENNIICKDMIVLKKKLNDKRDIKIP
ncbi:MAG TPA: GNAT family N-acetyltransferase, partial [Tissierellaceae bacterium]